MHKKRMLFIITAVALIATAFSGFRVIADAFRKEKAYQLIVGNKVWVTVSQKESLERLLEEYQQSYLVNIDEKARVKRIYFPQKVEIHEVVVRPEEIDALEAAREMIYAVREESVEVEVEKGDSFWSISKAHDLTVNVLEIYNPNVDPDNIHPGDKLIIKPLKPMLDVVVELENTIIEPVPFKNDYRRDHNLYQNQRTTIREGVEGEKEVEYHITLFNGYQRSLKVKKEKVIKKPVNAIVQIGTRTTVARGGRINYGVVHGTRISSNFGMRVHPITGRKRFHNGLDIAAPKGNGVYAYTDGTIVEAGWNGGYGIAILISHGNGMQTRYAHLSKLDVRVGQRVRTGQRIGAVGSTGNSTGPHLHFEVIVHGQTRNPLSYL